MILKTVKFIARYVFGVTFEGNHVDEIIFMGKCDCVDYKSIQYFTMRQNPVFKSMKISVCITTCTIHT